MTKIALQGNDHKENIILFYKDIKKLWEKWNIGSFVLLSLFLQFFLLFIASLRKKTAHKWVTFTIWTAYHLADWAASFAVGVVFDGEEKYTSSHYKMDDDTGLLLVLWAPFLLLLVGGQDRITSFAVQDNELWLRHLIWFILQLSTTGFVFTQSIHQNRLWIPTLLLLFAGTIKYAERIAALCLASSESFGISVLKEPNSGPNYEKIMRAYSTFKEMGLPTNFACLEDEKGRDSQVGKFITPMVKEPKLKNRELVLYAYGMSNMYKGLIVNLMFSSSEHKESRDFFSKINAEDTLRILEIELNFFYDLIHTKVKVATSKVGIISQWTSIGLVVAALSLFYKEEKRGFQRLDVKVTYTLFFGVLGLNMPLTKNLWEFIFKELEEKSRDAEDPEAAKRIISARGKWVLENVDFINDFESSILMSYVKDVAYDESLLLWHIATELCYNTDCDNCDDRELSKCLSDYMIYLLYQQPSLMSVVSGIAKQRFSDTSVEAQRFFSQRQRESERLEETYRCILEVDTKLKPVQVKGTRCKSVLFDANILAKEIIKLGSEKWQVTSKVWVELLSYAASRSSGNAHVLSGDKHLEKLP
uniref:DUF4220 domain-containing protein n=1 Tax=Quercus lobata TaxID=97700 RepID=A0A7N2L449_QUELO